MTRVLAVSPHLDDAVFSAGGRLAAHALAGDEVTVLTCFTGNVGQPTGFALACQLDKGLGAEVDYMALRRAEDLAACAAIGAAAVHLPLLEAPHRGYDSAAALFAGRRPDDTAEEALLPLLAKALDDAAAEIVYGPFGVGNHVDHLVVRAALERLCGPDRVLWWEDYPYAMREPAPPEALVREPVAKAPHRRKVAAVLAYRSQLGFQFGGADAAERMVNDWRLEAFTKT